MSRLALIFSTAALVTLIISGSARTVAAFGLQGDYNDNGIVFHEDYSVLGDTFGSFAEPPNSDGSGIVDFGDYAIYAQNFGNTLAPLTESLTTTIPLPLGLSLDVDSSPTPGGNVAWTFTFSGVDGALAGHLNISSDGAAVLSVVAGPMFQDDEFNPVGVPGYDEFNAVQSGILTGGNKAFVALGTNLLSSPSLLNSNSTLEFFTLTTTGTEPTTLTFYGAYGYRANDFPLNGSASHVPEPATVWLTGLGLVAGAMARRRRWPASDGSCLWPCA